MNIILARTSGFCFGVKHAVDTAYQLSEPGQQADQPPIYMLGELIHNRQIVEELKERGLLLAEREDDIPAGSRVLIRAHGVPPATICNLESRDCQITDCTCPFVTKIHRIVRQAWQQGKQIIIAGTPTHPEVVGINGECENSALILDATAQAEKMNFNTENWILVAQTTFSFNEYKKIRQVLKKKIAKLEIFDTICSTTENRQKEAYEIADQVDTMLVIGSSRSSNTIKLLEICQSRCGDTHLIEQPDQVRALLRERSLKGRTVGITAGASTPERVIREVIQTMTENDGLQNQQEQADVSFSDFIDNIPHLKRGAIVKGTIIRYDDDTVYVDVRDKTEGRIPRHEFDGDPDFDLDRAIEDRVEIDVYVRNIRNSDMGKEISLSKARVDFGKYKALIEEAYNEKTPITVKIVNVVKDGVIATYGGVDIYVHRTQLEMGIVDDLEHYREQTMDILVTQYDPDRRRLRVSGSRRALLSIERKAKAEELWKTIEIGKEYDGVVRSLTDFGAFVDIGGVYGLVHISELSWNRIRHPSEVVNVGDEIHVFVKDFDAERKRISLGYRRPENDPYRDVESRFPVGSIVHGIVVRMFPFGAFVEIAPGVDALCHISQIANVRLAKPNDVLAEGMEIYARVLEVSNEARRISISIKEVEPINPPGYGDSVAPTTYQDTFDQVVTSDVIETTVSDEDAAADAAAEPAEAAEATEVAETEDAAAEADVVEPADAAETENVVADAVESTEVADNESDVAAADVAVADKAEAEEEEAN
ncbi:MAG: bifunctional 4-hydroxy-3-methylbut-2-enyl diphosphate reductase/30S ribosomal protein S1 [Clostridiaceae bacterium]|nr:bifunctional 4-hydroxy-3-methylbut-2-enyl diphosphate reductase/30S ribosomal protein S1 [Clostridiaceae bacterium]